MQAKATIPIPALLSWSSNDASVKTINFLFPVPECRTLGLSSNMKLRAHRSSSRNVSGILVPNSFPLARCWKHLRCADNALPYVCVSANCSFPRKEVALWLDNSPDLRTSSISETTCSILAFLFLTTNLPREQSLKSKETPRTSKVHAIGCLLLSFVENLQPTKSNNLSAACCASDPEAAISNCG